MSSNRYREAGVDLDKANDLVARIKPLVRSTYNSGVLKDIGGFGGLYSLKVADIRNPVLVSSTDGVGTKLKIAFWANRHDTVGIDLVAMCVNDIIVQGARPLFFLDYLAMGKMELDLVEGIISGIVAGCKEAGCALIGGETAEMPDFYKTNEYDLAGFAVGVVDNGSIIDGSSIRVGNEIVGIASSGLHSNGYSLVRRIVFNELKLNPDSLLDGCSRTAAEELLEPTRIYVEPVLKLLRTFRIAGMVHITGGGFIDNIPRILPKACGAVINKDSWDEPPIFRFLREQGNIEEEEMFHVFNNGIGYVLVTEAKETDEILQILNAMGYRSYRIGEIVHREENAPPVQFV